MYKINVDIMQPRFSQRIAKGNVGRRTMFEGNYELFYNGVYISDTSNLATPALSIMCAEREDAYRHRLFCNKNKKMLYTHMKIDSTRSAYNANNLKKEYLFSCENLDYIH